MNRTFVVSIWINSWCGCLRPPFQPGPLLYSYPASTKFAATPEPIQANELVAPISSQRSHYLTIEILCGAAQVLLAQNPTS